MRNFRLILLFVSVCAGLAFSGCSSTVVMNGPSASGAAPSVVAVGDQVNGVAANRKQEVQFNEAMEAATINAQSFVVKDSAGNSVPGTVSYDSNFVTASFQPNPALQTNATYSVTITTAAASASGVAMAKPYSYSFTTRAESDTSPITVKSVNPAANATCVSASAPITITFDEAPDESTLTGANFAVTGPNGAIAVKISTNVSTTQVMLTPTSPLPAGTISVTVSNVADLAGVKMAAPYAWSFTTGCSGGGSTTTQYQAPLAGKSGSGQVAVDTTGNVAVQLQGASANQMYTVQFCPMIPLNQNAPACFAVATLSTDASGGGSVSAKFPQSGAWAGDFELVKGPVNPSTLASDYQTIYGPNYFSTLQPNSTLDGGILSRQAGNNPQAQLKSGTISYSSSPAPNGSFQFTLTGAAPNTTWTAVEGGIVTGGSENYELFDSQKNSNFTTDSQGNVTFTVLPDGVGGDILSTGPTLSEQGYVGGFSVP